MRGATVQYLVGLLCIGMWPFTSDLAPAWAQAKEPTLTADVAVYGGSAGGVIAAVAAAREGKTVLLIEPGRHVGGMVSGGLGATDVGNRLAIGGYAREFFDRVRTHYATKYGAGSRQVKDCGDGFRFEPHVAEQVFHEMLREQKVEVLLESRLDQVRRDDQRIAFITIEKPKEKSFTRIVAKVYIDAGYEGDLMAKAKVNYTVGREGREEFKESIAGVQKHSPAHQWPVKVSPFFDGRKLLPLVQAGPPGEPGSGDRKVQAYNFRMCMTQRTDQKIPWPKPENYDPKRFELLARYLEKRPDVLAREEFKDTNNWPHQLYVREARRLRGAYFMTETDIMDQRTKDDSVGLGSYNTDSHHVQRVVGADGFVVNEGDFQVGVKPYAIPYRSLVPKAADCRNLLVPVCMSATHVAYGTIRMEPVYMILGQASGVAAALAIEDQADVQEVAIKKLQAKLLAQKAVLAPEGIIKAGNKGINPGQMAGIVVDDTQATKTGFWMSSSATAGFVGDGYLHDNNEGQGKKAVRFTPKLPRAGIYEIRLHYPAYANRASNVLVIIHAASGVTSMHVNQKLAAKDGFRLGSFQFGAADEGWVEIRNDAADGFVIADAVQWIPVN
ncbi:MAG TPA: FAD-dependent oxidoreductase [Gemmataceae bacterium]|nr:FAD-dependent oxidoreductase [Gemmataceae bacterium]